MRALGEVRYKPPGVYAISNESRVTPITIADTHIAGFVGIASKGPLDTPRRLSCWNDFVEHYGVSSEGYLARSVEGFFQNGGKACYVVRVAKRPKQGQPLLPEHAAPSARVLKDAWDKETLRVLAQSEGRWGNNIWVSCKHAKGNDTFLTLDLPIGAGRASVKSTRGFERGSLVRIYDKHHSDYVILTKVDDDEKAIYWDSETPIMRAYSATGPTFAEVLEFEIHATQRDKREVFRHLQLSPRSRSYAPRIISERSELIRVEDLASTSQLPHKLPAPCDPEKLVGGRDGTDGISAEDFIGHDHDMDDRTGAQTLAYVEEVGLLLCPDAMLFYERQSQQEARSTAQRIQHALIDICENTHDRFAILDVPPLRDLEEIKQVRRARDSDFAACYFPWLQVPTAGGRTVTIPPSGHVAGVYSRCELREGVHKAPANEVLQGVTQLSLTLSDDHIGQLNSEGVNTLRAFVHPTHPAREGERPTGRGIRIWGARTLSSDPSWRYVNVRRLFIMLRRALLQGTRWATFEPNTPKTWSLLDREINLFLRSLHDKGYFAGTTAEESFIVRCDGEINTRERIEAGMMTADILVAPALPTEYILLSIEHDMAELPTEASR